MKKLCSTSPPRLCKTLTCSGWPQELKRLMALHGGSFQMYYSRSTVTHIICNNLPDAKVKQYERERYVARVASSLPALHCSVRVQAEHRVFLLLVLPPSRECLTPQLGSHEILCALPVGAPPLWSGQTGLWTASMQGSCCR